MSGVVRRRVIVHGRVQGVFFRDSCRGEAEARGVAGWIRNNSDGTVEAVFEGPEEAVDELLQWCSVGPEKAEVTGLERFDEPVERASAFRIV